MPWSIIHEAKQTSKTRMGKFLSTSFYFALISHLRLGWFCILFCDKAVHHIKMRDHSHLLGSRLCVLLLLWVSFSSRDSTSFVVDLSLSVLLMKERMLGVQSSKCQCVRYGLPFHSTVLESFRLVSPNLRQVGRSVFPSLLQNLSTFPYPSSVAYARLSNIR